MKCDQCDAPASTRWAWPDDNTGKPRTLELCTPCGIQRWEWLKANANRTNMMQAVTFCPVAK